MTGGIDAARARPGALVDVSAALLAIALKARLTFAGKVCGQIAAFRVLNASRRYRGILTLIDVLTVKTIADVAGKARTCEAS
jgi:hypothetical protein